MTERILSSSIPLGRIERSMGRLLLRAAADHPEARFFNEFAAGGWKSVTWREALARMASLVEAFQEWGLRKGDRIVCKIPNGGPMLIWEMAALCSGVVSVPLFAGLEAGPARTLAREVAPRALLAAPAGDARSLLSGVSGRPKALGPETLESIYARPGDAAVLEKACRAVAPEDLALLQFTSGTTGRLKGVLLTHRNLASQQKAYTFAWDIPAGSRFLSYLPWHHSFGGISERFTALVRGAGIFLEPSAGRDPDRLLEAWKRVRPTHFCSVPKVYVRLMNRLRGDVSAERLFFHHELNSLFTAGAPLPAECTRYFESRGARLMEGWGLTETSPTVTMTDPGERRIHTVVGHPIPGVRVKVAADGELLVKGPNVMRGYFRDPALTAAAFDGRGWFKTGDLGAIMPEGLRIICRRDGVFKLLNGEKVASVPLEEAITLASRRIQHAVVLGEGRDFVAVLLFADPSTLPALTGGGTATLEAVRNELEEALRPYRSTYAEVRAAAVVPRELSISEGELTPTLKVVRTRVLERCAEWVEAIYRAERHPELQKTILRMGDAQGGRTGL